MKLWKFLFGNAASVEDEAPDIVVSNRRFVPTPINALEESDERDERRTHERSHCTDVGADRDLENVYCILEYVDAEGDETRRRITMQALKFEGGHAYVRAVCHERRALRSFRVDRMSSIITADGEVFSPAAFFKDFLEIDFDHLDRYILQPQREAGQVAGRMRDFLRPSLSILVCAAKADGDFDHAELDQIMIYAEREASILHREGKLDVAPTLEGVERLKKLVENMRPQRSSLGGYVQSVFSTSDPERISRFVDALTAVVFADGRLSVDERELVEEVMEVRQKSSSEREEFLEQLEAERTY